MAYRRPDDTGPLSSRWRLKHRGELTALGIAADIASSDDRWSYVLFHGDDLESGWDESWLSDDQARKLAAFLTSHFSDTGCFDLVERLQRRLGMRG
jgi:hypothetical protein